MSLLEDVFLQDEANEAEELERVIERDDSDDGHRSEEEAEEDKRRVDPSKAKAPKVVKNPRFLLNPARLTGPRGIQVIPDHFKDFKFKGKGHEKEDLDLVLKKLEHWAYRLYPKFQFEDCLKKIETLGRKKAVAVHLHKIRSDQFLTDDTVVQKDSSDDETPAPVQEEDEFDKLLQQQIELARSTPAPNSAKKHAYDSPMNRAPSVLMPKATSSPSISNDQRERMLRNRQLAEERRLARLNAANGPKVISNNSSNVNSGNQSTVCNTENIEPNEGRKVMDSDDIEAVRKHNRSNVLDSSDDEMVEETNVAIAVDVHTVITNDDSSDRVNKDTLNLNEDRSDDETRNMKRLDTDNFANSNNSSNFVNSETQYIACNTENIESNEGPKVMETDDDVVRKHNRLNVIDSSDDETIEGVIKNDKSSDQVKTNTLNLNKDKSTDDTINMKHLDSDNFAKSNANIDKELIRESEKNFIGAINNSEKVSKEQIEISKDIENTVNLENVSETNNISANSEGEVLRYDDSDINIELNGHISDQKAEDTNEIDPEETINTIGKSLNGTDTKDKGELNNALASDKVSEEIMDEVMDVDFSEEF